MNQQTEYSKYYRTLEIAEGSPYSDVREAYERLKSLYEGDSIVLSPLEDELSDEWKERILGKIEEAYEKLSESFQRSGYDHTAVRERAPAVGGTDSQRASAMMNDESYHREVASIKSFSGEELRRVRNMLKLEIHEVSLETKIGKQHIKNIEEENFSALPEEVFLRGYLLACARLYRLDHEKVTADYLQKYRVWKQGS